MTKSKLPEGYKMDGDKVRDSKGRWVEEVNGKWLEVLDARRSGWWRHHEHYDRDGYCDNPGRGY
jgi:hypothetical protein